MTGKVIREVTARGEQYCTVGLQGEKKKITQSLCLTESASIVFSENAGFGTVQQATVTLSFTFQFLCNQL